MVNIFSTVLCKSKALTGMLWRATEKMTLTKLSNINDLSYLVTITPEAMAKLFGWTYPKILQQRYYWPPKDTLTASNHRLSRNDNLLTIKSIPYTFHTTLNSLWLIAISFCGWIQPLDPHVTNTLFHKWGLFWPHMCI